jgi:hypothetical protein
MSQVSDAPISEFLKVAIAGQAEAASWAFVPNPLLPALDLDLSRVQALRAPPDARGRQGVEY